MSTTVFSSISKIASAAKSLIRPVISASDRTYWGMRQFLRKAQWWTPREIEIWQLQQFKRMVEYAYDNVPGYRALYQKQGVKPQDIRTVKDVKLLPIVSKELLRDNLPDFTSKSIPGWRRFYSTTSGSTGIPFGFFQTRTTVSVEKAFMHASWERASWTPGDRAAILRGKFVGSEERFWRYDTSTNELLLSSYYLSDRTYKQYVAKMSEYAPLHLRAYPSTASTFADLILSNSDNYRVKCRSILLGSEHIYSWQKRTINRAFPEAKLFGWYGHAEKVILAPMCELSEQYHVWPFYGYTEILNEKGEESQEDELGELVGTSFWNYATPFIRYKTMDIARRGACADKKCGRQFQLLKDVEGRIQDALVSATGKPIPLPSTSIHSGVFDNVKQFQFYQEIRGKVVLRIARKASYRDEDTYKIQRSVEQKLADAITLDIVFVTEIPKTSGGKYKALDQRLQVNTGSIT